MPVLFSADKAPAPTPIGDSCSRVGGMQVSSINPAAHKDPQSGFLNRKHADKHAHTARFITDRDPATPFPCIRGITHY